MDFQQAKQYFNVLYEEVNGYGISAQARAKVLHQNKGHTYGEIVPESFQRMVGFVQPKKGEVFYDLGSGTGKAVILASMLFAFSRCIGIEIFKELYETSVRVLDRYTSEVRAVQNTGTNMEFVNADFLTHDCSDGDVFFMHATCFDDDLMARIAKHLVQVKKGTRIITVTKTLDSPGFVLLSTQEYYMGWGKASVNFYMKTSS